MLPEQLENQEEFQALFERIEYQNENIFITGKAGTGKSTFLNYLKKKTTKNCVVVAPTGVAALNVGGQTIHSFFKFKPRMMDLQQIKPLKAKQKLYQQLQLLIIDEISMVRADIFDAIEKFLSLNGPKPGEVFGGVQICVIGDLFQLPPVVTSFERPLYFQQYRTPFFFGAHSFVQMNIKLVELERVYRQQDQPFIALLNRVRDGKVLKEDIELLNQRYIQPGLTPSTEIEEEAIILATTNGLADQVNLQQLKQLPGNEYCYKGKAEGEFEQADERLPAPRELKLKIGTHVMFTRNDGKKRWVNGTIGVISELKEREIQVKVRVKGQVRYYTIEPEEWESIRYEYDMDALTIKEKVIGSYRQYPLIYAWAITIHKSQGKTLERIHIDLGNGAFMAGQLYVALSRCPKLADIWLRTRVRYQDVRMDSNVAQFYKAYLQPIEKKVYSEF